MDDWSLLQEYVHHDSKGALDKLVRRHLTMVYAAALRQVRDPHLAEDVTQMVFLVLMRRAAKISRKVVLGGWLFKVTVYTAARMRRSEGRRQRHEKSATATGAVEPQAPIEQLRVDVLDEAISAMPPVYRDVVVMRYLQGKTIREVAQSQNVSENAARQRLFRALAKLRSRLARKGVVETEAGISTLLSAAGALTPGADITGRIVGGFHVAAAGDASSPLVSAILRSLIMAKLKTSLSVVLVILLIGLGGGLAYWTVWRRSPAPVAPALGPKPATAASEPAIDGTPNSVVLNVITAFRAGDVNAMIDEIEPLNPEQAVSFRRITLAAAATTQLRSALSKRFGTGPAERFMEGISLYPSQNDMTVVEQAEPTINADRAQMTIRHLGVMSFVKLNGVWKLKADAFQDTFSKIGTAGPLLDQIATDLSAGKYAQIEQVRADLFKKLRDLQNPDPVLPPDRPKALTPGATPQETLAVLYWAAVSGDEDAAIACVLNPTPGQQHSIRIYTQLASAGEKIRAAVAERFGVAEARMAVLKLGMDTGISKDLLQKAPQIFPGDKAQVDFRHTLGITINLTKIDGVWKMESMWDDAAPNPSEAAYAHDHRLSLYQRLCADVQDGRFKSVAQLRSAVDALGKQILADRRQQPASAQP